MVTYLRRCSRLSALALLCAAVVGCGEASTVEDAHKSNLRGLAVWYSQYQARNGGNVPRNEEEFKAFIRTNSPQAAADGSLEKMFVSDRDGKPYIVRYRGDKKWRVPDIIAYEQEGASGTRYAAGILGGVEALTEEEFNDRMATAIETGPGRQK